MMMLPVLALLCLGAFLVVAFSLIGAYNGLVQLKNQVANAWSQIDVQLKRRHDLIPNLVEAVKGYMGHERDTLEAVIKARQQVVNVSSDNVAAVAQAEGALAQSLKSLFAVAESYPDLKANQNFLALQEELTSTENKVGFARQHYNDSVMQYNNKVDMFPSNLIAGMFNFKSAEFFEVEIAEERAVPKVAF